MRETESFNCGGCVASKASEGNEYSPEGLNDSFNLESQKVVFAFPNRLYELLDLYRHLILAKLSLLRVVKLDYNGNNIAIFRKRFIMPGNTKR